MQRVLVDTSAWIHALRRDGDPEIRAKVGAAAVEGRAVLCDLVLLELWNGARGDDEQRMLQQMERELEKVPTTPAVWTLAAQMARHCRQAGVTVPATDLLIAACAEHHELGLLHRDGHYEQIAQVRRPHPAPANPKSS